MSNFSPREIVSELDRYIVGQHDAKRAVAIALRNRWRRLQLEETLREEVMPKNILMIGPTGVRQDRDFAPSRQARRRAFPQGGSHQVHRSRLCRPRCRADRARSGRYRHRPGEGRKAQGGRRPSAHLAAEERVLNALVGATASPATRESVPQEATRRRTRRQGNRDRDKDDARPRVRLPGMPGARSASSRSATFRQGLSAAAPRRAAPPSRTP